MGFLNNRPGKSLKTIFSRVPFPTPDGPTTTMGLWLEVDEPIDGEEGEEGEEDEEEIEEQEEDNEVAFRDSEEG